MVVVTTEMKDWALYSFKTPTSQFKIADSLPWRQQQL